jgi:hypothetical protein
MVTSAPWVGLGGDDREQGAGPAVTDGVGQAAPGRLEDARVQRRERHVLRQQRHVVADGDDLAEQRQPEHLRGHDRGDLRRPGEGHRCRRPQWCRRHGHLAAVAQPEVAQQEIVGVEQGATGAGLRDRGDAGRRAPAGERDRITGAQAQRGEHLGVQPDHAAAGVQRRWAQTGGERQGRGHESSV